MFTTFYKGRAAAAGEGFAVVPEQVYKHRGARVPATIKAFTQAGILEQLDGDPGPGFDCVELSAEALAKTTRRDPVAAPRLDLPELCKRLGWSMDDLKDAHKLNFPYATLHRGGAASLQNPHAVAVPVWEWDLVTKWLRENARTAAKIVAAASAAK